jgi:hypothetical protein
LTYATLALGSESYSLHPSWLAYALYYSAYTIIPTAFGITLFSQIFRANRLAALGLVAVAFPLASFYTVAAIS